MGRGSYFDISNTLENSKSPPLLLEASEAVLNLDNQQIPFEILFPHSALVDKIYRCCPESCFFDFEIKVLLFRTLEKHSGFTGFEECTKKSPEIIIYLSLIHISEPTRPY